MNFEPFAPFERSEPLVSPPPNAQQPPAPHYFDRAGLAWIAGCLLFAGVVGYALPYAAEPDGWHRALLALGFHTMPPANVASLPQRQVRQPPQPTRVGSAEPGDARLNPSVLRQY